MKKKVTALFAAVLVLFSSLSCYAVEARASRYFDGYILAMTAQGNNQMAVSFSVFGMGEMDKIGAYYIRIEEEIATDEWIKTFTAYGDKMPDKFYSYNAYDHTGSYTFTGVPGVKYRAVMKAYAEDENGSEYSKEFTCTGRVCK